MVKKNLDRQQLKTVCDVLEETKSGYTKTELTRLLEQSKIEVVQAKKLDEVDRRVSSLQRQLYNRVVHSEVQKYCIKDYL